MTRLVAVEELWDTVVSLHLHGPGAADARAAILGVFGEVDATLSRFRTDSALSRWRRGELALADCPREVREVLALALDASSRTGGAFDPWWDGGRGDAADAGGPWRGGEAADPSGPWRDGETADPSGPWRGGRAADPTGLLKGWAAERAMAAALACGVTGVQVNAGGDVCTAGSPGGGRPWRIGIEAPGLPGRLLDVVSGHDVRVATSGTDRRGAHVLRQGRSARGALSVTVVGPDLALADAYSTAALALGGEAPALLDGLDDDGYPSLLVRDDGTIVASAGWPGQHHGGSSARQERRQARFNGGQSRCSRVGGVATPEIRLHLGDQRAART